MGRKPKQSKPTRHPEKSSAVERQANQQFPIVGIGASAGGLEALEVFFEQVPEKSGMAFVVIMHLSPEHKSHLAGLLQHHTAMVVTEMTETVKVEPDHVYIIPPNKNLSLSDGQLRLSRLEVPPTRRAPIDQFFRTLAQAHSRDAVCIILSGTGTDGTLGLRAIKEQGGLTMVQSPEEAGHEGMPRSAMATGLVDFVLPVKELAEKLIAYKESAATIKLPEQEEALRESDSDALLKIFALLLAKTGHDFAHYKRSTILRRLTRRLQMNQILDFFAYLRFLQRRPEEVLALFNDLLICVTNFFRDPEAFEALETTVIPKLFDGKGSDDQVRVWVAGCATGEEAYSVAMLLVEQAAQLDRAPEIQVFATDVSDEAIVTARQGLYPASIAADLSPERLKRFFARESGSYRVKKEIREVVLFAVHDLLKAPPFSRLDLVTCRNLLIYLNGVAQQQVFGLFHYALLPNGYLFLGTSESAEGMVDLFAATDKTQHIFQRSAVSRAAPHLPSLPIGRTVREAPSAGEAAGKKTFRFGELHQKMLEQYAPPSLMVNEHYDIVHMSDHAGRYVQFVGGEPTLNLLQVVRAELQTELRTALYLAFRKRTATESKWVRVDLEGEPRRVRLIVRPAENLGAPQQFALVIFAEVTEPQEVEAEEHAEEPPASASPRRADVHEVAEQLEQELRDAKEQLRATIEQYETSNEELKASNEELQSLNEELKSTTEELETSKEELQSTNEELVTLNQEHKNKIEELNHANSDLHNLMDSTDIGTLFLDRDLRITRFTPPVTELFNITATDRGRPLAHFTNKLGHERLLQDAEHVLGKLTPVEREIHSEEDRWYLVRLLPYRSVDDKIEGVVITFVDVTERKQMELIVQEARDYAEAVLETMRHPLMILDADLRVQSTNRAFCQAFQLTPSEIEGHLFYALNNRQWDIPELRKLLEKVIPEQTTIEDFEIVFDAEGMAPQTIILNARMIRRRPRHPALILLVMEDISERKQAEEALQESQARTQAILDTTIDAIITIDEQGCVESFNPAAERIFGYDAEEVVGGPVKILMPSPYQEKHDQYLRHYLKTGEKKIIGIGRELVALRKDGSTFPIDLAVGEMDIDGRRLFTGFVRDITERKKAEEALRRSEANNRAMLQAIPDMIFWISKEGLYLAVVSPDEHKLALSAQEIVGRTLADILPPELATRIEHSIPKVLQTGRLEHMEYSLKTLDKQEHDFEARIVPLEGNGVLAIVRDMTAQRRLERQILEATAQEQRRIGQDLHDVLGSHLTGASMLAQSLTLDAKEGKPVKPETLEKVTRFILEGIEQTRALARGLYPIKLEKQGLAAALQELADTVPGYAKTPCSFESQGTLPDLTEEVATHLYRIAQEAVNNAVKHAAATHIQVRLAHQGNMLLLTVHDDGVGLPEKLDDSDGMGLHVMRYRARIIGATLNLNAPPEGGTLVTCALPIT